MHRPWIAVSIVLGLSAHWTPAQPTQPAAPLPGASLVTLKLSEATPDIAFAQLAKQSGFAIQPLNENYWQRTLLGQVSLTADRMPFWQAFREICDRSGVMLYSTSYGDRRLLLVPAKHNGSANFMKSPAAFSGPFMIAVETISRSSTVDLSAPQTIHRNMQLQLRGLAEPKLKLLQASYYAQLDAALDEKGASLLPSSQGNPRSMSPVRGVSWIMYASLQSSTPSERIALLRGRAIALIQTSSETFEVKDVAKARDLTRTVAGCRVTFNRLTKLDDRYSADVVLSRDGLMPAQAGELLAHASARLIDGNSGYIYPPLAVTGWRPATGPATTRPVGPIELKLQFSLRADGRRTDADQPTTLEWELVTGTQELVVPFEFRDIALP